MSKQFRDANVVRLQSTHVYTPCPLPVDRLVQLASSAEPMRVELLDEVEIRLFLIQHQVHLLLLPPFLGYIPPPPSLFHVSIASIDKSLRNGVRYLDRVIWRGELKLGKHDGELDATILIRRG